MHLQQRDSCVHFLENAKNEKLVKKIIHFLEKERKEYTEKKEINTYVLLYIIYIFNIYDVRSTYSIKSSIFFVNKINSEYISAEAQNENSTPKESESSTPNNPPPPPPLPLYALVSFFADLVGSPVHLLKKEREFRLAKSILSRVSLEDAKLAILKAFGDPFIKSIMLQWKSLNVIDQRLPAFLPTRTHTFLNCVDPNDPYYVILPNGNREPKVACICDEGEWRVAE